MASEKADASGAAPTPGAPADAADDNDEAVDNDDDDDVTLVLLSTLPSSCGAISMRGDVGGEVRMAADRAEASVAGSSSSSRSSSVSVSVLSSSLKPARSMSSLGGAGGASGFCMSRA